MAADPGRSPSPESTAKVADLHPIHRRHHQSRPRSGGSPRRQRSSPVCVRAADLARKPDVHSALCEGRLSIRHKRLGAVGRPVSASQRGQSFRWRRSNKKEVGRERRRGGGQPDVARPSSPLAIR